MELLCEIYDQDVLDKPLAENPTDIRYRIRKAARAVLQNRDGRIALLYASKDRYHKLPGGGLEQGENIMAALRRELLEEVGAEIGENPKELGMIIEYRDVFGMLQISYCYLARVQGEPSQPSFTEQELADGFSLRWVLPAEALRLLAQDQPGSDAGRFIRLRDLRFLEAAFPKE